MLATNTKDIRTSLKDSSALFQNEKAQDRNKFVMIYFLSWAFLDLGAKSHDIEALQNLLPCPGNGIVEFRALAICGVTKGTFPFVTFML